MARTSWRPGSGLSGCPCVGKRGLAGSSGFTLGREPKQVEKPKASLADLLGNQTRSVPLNEKHNFQLSHRGWRDSW